MSDFTNGSVKVLLNQLMNSVEYADESLQESIKSLTVDNDLELHTRNLNKFRSALSQLETVIRCLSSCWWSLEGEKGVAGYPLPISFDEANPWDVLNSYQKDKSKFTRWINNFNEELE